MAVATTSLIAALRQTAIRLREERVTYRWSSFASCNCGHLAQTLTGLSAAELRAAAGRAGEWREEAENVALRGGFPEFDYGDRPALDEGAWEPENVGACTATGTPLDELFARLSAHGLSAEDLTHLERLSDPQVRRRLGTHREDYRHNDRHNVVAYLRAWADLLEERLVPGACDRALDLPLAAE